MKKTMLLITLISASIYAQKKIDYSSWDKTKLKKELELRDSEFQKLSDSLKRTISLYDALKDEKLSSSKKQKVDEINQLKKIIKDINEIYFKEILISKYASNNDYVEKTDLVDEDIIIKIKKSSVLLNSIKVDEKDEKIIAICNKALGFNENYIALYTIRQDIFSGKYDETKNNEALAKIKKLPILEPNSKLEISKQRIISLLNNYLENNCLLKKQLDILKKAEQSPILKEKYSKLEKDEHYKDYPYLVKVIRKIKNNVNDYSKDDLHPCESNSENSTIDPK